MLIDSITFCVIIDSYVILLQVGQYWEFLGRYRLVLLSIVYILFIVERTGDH